MAIDPTIVDLSTRLGSVVANNTIPTIMDRINQAKATKEKDQTIKYLEGIINDLISDKNELVTISRAYEEELIEKKISEDDIDYISNNLMPLIENLVHQQSDEHKAEKMEKDLEMMKPLLSDRTFKILQLLGFNFKRAIGEPLTELVDNYITSQIPLNDEISIENRNLAERKTIEFYKILQDKEAYERLKEVNSRLFTNEQS